jgi:hypothetical protein
MSINSKFMGAIAATDCVICREFEGVRTPAHVHHVAEGSAPRSDLLTVALCPDHHVGSVGIHGMGVKQFCRLYRLPNEFYLLELQHKYMVIDGLIKV